MTDTGRKQPSPPPLTADRVHALVGTLSDAQVASILKTGASEGELLEALMWLERKTDMGHEVRRPPAGRAAEILDILSADRPDEDER